MLTLGRYNPYYKEGKESVIFKGGGKENTLSKKDRHMTGITNLAVSVLFECNKEYSQRKERDPDLG